MRRKKTHKSTASARNFKRRKRRCPRVNNLRRLLQTLKRSDHIPRPRKPRSALIGTELTPPRKPRNDQHPKNAQHNLHEERRNPTNRGAAFFARILADR